MKTKIEIKIRNYHVDHFNHVNHARFIEFMEEARWSYLEDNNLLKRFKKNNLPHVVVKISINYRKIVRFGDILCIETQPAKLSNKSFTIRQSMFINGTDTLAADAEVTNVFVEPTSGKVIPIDEAILDLWPDLKMLSKKGDI